MDNRAKGWQHAKISGHENEENIAKELGEGYFTKKTKVPSIFGDKTIPKRDLYGPTSPSIKKSISGQASLTPTYKFICAYEKIYGEIPNEGKDCLYLMFGGYKSIDLLLSNKNLYHPNPKIFETERKRKTLCVETIEKHNPELLQSCLNWFANNMDKIVELVFERGYSINTEDFATYIIYKNTIGENCINKCFQINELKKISLEKNHVSFGKLNGGTTIDLPFGHLQYHKGMMQFHHNYNKINLLFSDTN